MRDITKIGDAIIDTVKGYVGTIERALAKKIEAIEMKFAELPAPKDGEAGPAGKDGQPGKDAPPVDIAAVVQTVLAAIPVPKDGQPGNNGVDGKDGADGKSFTPEEVDLLVEARVKSALLDFERRAYDVMQKAVDRLPRPLDGKDGNDGLNGFGFEDMTVDYDGERLVSLKFVQGDRTKSYDLELPMVIDRGVFKEGNEYKKGDGVTWAGSFWIAQSVTKSKPDCGDGSFRLAVKRGRDGREGRDGIDKTAGVKLS